MGSIVALDYWTLEEALKLIRGLQPRIREIGYHITLGGGVLNHGMSKKDLDLFFLPLEGEQWKPSPEKVLKVLTDLWGPGKSFFDPPHVMVEQQQQQSWRRGYYVTTSPTGTGLTIVAAHPPPTQPPYEDVDNSIFHTKAKFTYGGLRIDVFISHPSLAIPDEVQLGATLGAADIQARIRDHFNPVAQEGG